MVLINFFYQTLYLYFSFLSWRCLSKCWIKLSACRGIFFGVLRGIQRFIGFGGLKCIIGRVYEILWFMIFTKLIFIFYINGVGGPPKGDFNMAFLKQDTILSCLSPISKVIQRDYISLHLGVNSPLCLTLIINLLHIGS